jgi:hypothetical protein
VETFEEISRITNVSATIFPSLPRALFFKLCEKILYLKLKIMHLIAKRLLYTTKVSVITVGILQG